MALAPGTLLGPYEVLALLGAGGMGEVYRARDPRLGREVAIKVLPAAFSADADRLRRFEQEARAAGLLNHPNILAIYDVGVHEGCSFVVSELLEGETLRDRLRGSHGTAAATPPPGGQRAAEQGHPLPPRKTVECGIQVARGLAAAHAKGIVHRDLKPENLFITKDAQMKILDFGLAKLTEPRGSAANLTSAPTTPATPLGTEPGVVMGTVGYMSPEQVRGQPADPRSDVFSFGAILYEMLTGARAFEGDSSVETMNAILKEEPPELLETGRHIPPALDRVVRHCLEKNPDERFQSARDLAFDLEAVSLVSATGAVPAISAPAGRRRRITLALAALGLVAALGAGFFAGKQAGQGPPPLFHQLTFRRGTVWSARFAPDGQTVVYGAAWEGHPIELFASRVDSPESRSLGLPGTDVLAISSSGGMAILSRLRFTTLSIRTGTLSRVPLAGGAPRDVLEDVQEADFAPDGSGLAVVRWVGPRCRLEFPIGHVLDEASGWVTCPRVSPHGDLVAFLDHPVYADDRGSVAVVDRAGKKRTLSDGYASENGLAWSASGDRLWFTATEAGSNRALYTVTMAGQRRLVSRVPGTLTVHDVWRDGRLLVSHDNLQRGLVVAPGGTKERDLSWLDWSYLRDISADGKEVLFDEEGEGAGATYAVYLRKTDGSPAVRLGEGYGVALSPDGKQVLSLIPYALPPQLALLPTGAGEPRVLPGDHLHYRWAAWFPDGKRILAVVNDPGGGSRFYTLDPEGGSPRPVGPERVPGGSFRLSPDGKTVATLGSDRKVALIPLEGGEPRPVAGAAEGEAPIGWSADGRSLFLVHRGDLPVRVFRVDLSTGRRELWKEITPPDPTGVIGVAPIVVTPDGKSYAYGFRRALSELYLIEGLK